MKCGKKCCALEGREKSLKSAPVSNPGGRDVGLLPCDRRISPEH